MNRILQGSAEYAWANNEQNLGRLRTQFDALQGTLASEFASDFMVMDARSIKEKYESSDLDVFCRQFVQECEPALKELDTHRALIVRRSKLA